MMKKLIIAILLAMLNMSVVVGQENQNVYDIVDKMPEFPGGRQAMIKFLASNVKYPMDAEQQKIGGKVVVAFVVEKDGSISDVKVVKEVYPSLDAEAVRVVKAMPKWTPGIMDGNPVRVRFTLPVNFRMQKPDAKVAQQTNIPLMTKTVTVKKAGTLAELLTDEEKLNVGDLTIEGKLNSTDVILLRKMAGAKDKRDDNPWKGQLRRLDLSNANFENDKTPYYSAPVGKNYKVSIKLKDSFLVKNRHSGKSSFVSRDQYLRAREERWEGSSQRMLAKDVTKMDNNSVLDNGGKKIFEFSKLTEQEWREMLRHGWNEHTDHFESRPEGDSVFYVNCHTAKSWISHSMFYKCVNLETIVLNENTERISANAFAGCKLLKEIVIPRKVEKIGTSAFKKTPSLSKVSISRKTEMPHLKSDDSSIIRRFFKDSSPEIEIVRY